MEVKQQNSAGWYHYGHLAWAGAGAVRAKYQ